MREQVIDIDIQLKGRLHERNRSVIGIEREQFAHRVWQSGCEYQYQVNLLAPIDAFTGVTASVSSQGELSMMRRWLRFDVHLVNVYIHDRLHQPFAVLISARNGNWNRSMKASIGSRIDCQRVDVGWNLESPATVNQVL